jgi:TetR/AcrR family transcriptional regulator, transcriptional repressor for nem operon
MLHDNSGVKAKLIEAGISSILKAGYNATSIKDIIDNVGIPKGSFYYYFESKEAFVGNVIDAYTRKNLELSSSILKDFSQLPLTRLRKYLDLQIGYFRELGYTQGCLLGNISIELADHNEFIRLRLVDSFVQWKALVRETFREAITQGEISSKCNSESLASFFINSWEGALIFMKLEKSVHSLELFVNVFFDYIYCLKDA